MDFKKIIITLLVVAILVAAVWFGYGYVKTYLESTRATLTEQQELINILRQQQGVIANLKTEIADVEKRVVNDTLKETVVVTQDSQTYEGVKEELIRLRENEEENKEEIAALRETFEKRIDEFQESPDKIMVKSGEEKIVIYEDSEGNLVSLSEGVEIIRHRNVEDVIEPKKDLVVGQTEEELNDKFSLSILYNGDFSPSLSYKVLNLQDFSLNITGYDFEQLKLGVDLGYSFKGNLEIAGGVGLVSVKDFDTFRDYYIRFGIRIEF